MKEDAAIHIPGEQAGRAGEGRGLATLAFAALACAQLCSLFGEAVLRFVLPLHVLNLTGQATVYGLVVAAGFLPYIAATPLGGIAADRVPRRALMAALACLCLLYLACAGLFDAAALTVAVLMVLYAVQGFYQPTVQSCVAFLVPRERIEAGVAVVTQISALTGIVGPVAGGMVFGFFGLVPILIVSCAAFAASCALILAFVRVPFARRASGEGVISTLRADAAEAAAFLREQPLLSRGIVLVAVANLAVAGFAMVGMPYIVTEHLSLSNQLMGMAEGSLAAGGLAGGIAVSLASSRFSLACTPRYLAAAGCMLAAAAAVLAAPIPPIATYAGLLACMALMMACCTVFSIVAMAFVQAQTPPHLVGKVVALVMAAANCATPAGQLVYGVGFDTLPPFSLALIAAAVAVCAAFLWRGVLTREGVGR